MFTPAEHEIVRSWTAPLVRGTPEHVRAELEALAQRTGADELMITTMVHGPADRLRSYELLAEAWMPLFRQPGQEYAADHDQAERDDDHEEHGDVVSGTR